MISLKFFIGLVEALEPPFSHRVAGILVRVELLDKPKIGCAHF